MDTFAVFSPEGRAVPRATPKDTGRAVPSLTSGVVAQVWDYRFRGDEVFSALRESLGALRPGIGFVDYDEFGDIHGTTAEAVVDALPGRLFDTGTDAAVVGIGA